MSDDGGGSTQQVHRWIGIVGMFIAPTTIITSVCVYFGFVSTRKYYSYFGIDSNAIGFATSDYVMQSISILFAPILVLLIGWAALLWAGAVRPSPGQSRTADPPHSSPGLDRDRRRGIGRAERYRWCAPFPSSR